MPLVLLIKLGVRFYHFPIAATLKSARRFFSWFFVCTALAVGQSPPSRAIHTPGGDVVIPVTSGLLGHRDSAALTEVANHLAAVGAVSWGGFQGTGKITYGSKDTTSYDATFSNFGGNNFRLDAQTSKGAMSIRIHQRIGKIQDSDGRLSPIPLDTAMLGLFPFEAIRVGQFPGQRASLFDHGLATIDGAELHRITFEFEAIGINPATKSPETIATDLYFDPASHLLIKSVAYVLMPQTRNVKLLDVITYADYRKVGASMIPFRYTETMEGEPYWMLQLSDVQLNPSFDATYFQFEEGQK